MRLMKGVRGCRVAVNSKLPAKASSWLVSYMTLAALAFFRHYAAFLHQIASRIDTSFSG